MLVRALILILRGENRLIYGIVCAKNNMSSYTQWKSWDVADFGVVPDAAACYYAKIFDQFFKGDRLPARILEVGYGNGVFLGWCRLSGYDVSGIEAEQGLIERASKAGFNIYNDIERVPNGSLDAIFLFDVLEHIPQDLIASFLLKLNGVLKQGGAVVIRTPNGASPLGLANQHGDPTHVTVVTTTKIHFWAAGVGFDVAYSGRDLFPIYDGRLLKVPGRLIKLVLRNFIERVFRFVFSPQSSGALSANLLTVLIKSPK